MPSHYGAHWTTGLDLGWQSTLLTHIRHGEATKETFRDRYPQVDYSGPVDGWYLHGPPLPVWFRRGPAIVLIPLSSNWRLAVFSPCRNRALPLAFPTLKCRSMPRQCSEGRVVEQGKKFYRLFIILFIPNKWYCPYSVS